MMNGRGFLAAAALAAALAGPVMQAHAAAPVFSGQLGTGNYAGAVAAESGPFTDGANWSFWKFKADFLSEVEITVTPDAMLDPFIAVWYGIETDTGNYFDMVSSSVQTTFVASADGLTEFAGGGIGEPARVRFLNDYGNEYFTLAVADYIDGVGAGQLNYTIAAAVPEPETYLQLLAGLGLLAGALRYRQRPQG